MFAIFHDICIVNKKNPLLKSSNIADVTYLPKNMHSRVKHLTVALFTDLYNYKLIQGAKTSTFKINTFRICMI